MRQRALQPGDLLLTSVANGICTVKVLRVVDGRVHYEWPEGALGSTTVSEVGGINQTDRDYSFVLFLRAEGRKRS